MENQLPLSWRMRAQASLVFHLRRVDGNLRTSGLRSSDNPTFVRGVSGYSRRPIVQGARRVRPQTRNWLTATLAISLLVILAAALGSLTGQRNPDPFLRRPSAFFTDESGARALLLVMQGLLPWAERWWRRRHPLALDRDAG